MSRRVAIVGSGPSGLFAAQVLAAEERFDVFVDVFDRLPTPYGLLRYGVAPDHTSIKAMTAAFARAFEHPRVSYRGLVEFGAGITRSELLSAYDAVVYAAGASEDRRLGIPGEDLHGSRSAREFVAWYSGHPDAHKQKLRGVRRAVTIGVGNVAVDVARILLKDPDDLATTDMPERVLAELRRHEITDVWIIGRRGPQHASFTTQELRELLSIPGVAVHVDDEIFDDIDPDSLDRRTKANIAALQDARLRIVEEPRARLHFMFWHRPVALTGHDGAVTEVHLERTAPAGGTAVTGAGEPLSLPADLVLRAIGYHGKPLRDVPFDGARGVIPNSEGRVTTLDGEVLEREYVVGWIKRGPVGVIGTNKRDAAETARHLLDDLAATEPRTDLADVDALLAARGIRSSSFEDWTRIDEAEVTRGGHHGRARTKIEAWHELNDLVSHERPGGPAAPGDPESFGAGAG